jgi:uncharacterized membrane protein YadS
MGKNNLKIFVPLIVVFFIVSICCIGFNGFLSKHNTDYLVVLAANFLLFGMSVFSLYRQIGSLSNSNPHAMVRGVMGAVVLKLFVLGTAAFLYLYISGEQKSVNALFIGMALYLIYTWLEVKISMQLNPPKNGGN